jgi:hypothetical protein
MTISSNGAAPGQVPEPATLSLFAIGLAATAANRRRKSAKPVSNSALNEVVCA